MITWMIHLTLVDIYKIDCSELFLEIHSGQLRIWKFSYNFIKSVDESLDKISGHHLRSVLKPNYSLSTTV